MSAHPGVGQEVLWATRLLLGNGREEDEGEGSGRHNNSPISLQSAALAYLCGSG